MAKMQAVQVGKAGGELEVVEREIPSPGPGQVRGKVEACGICMGDGVVKAAIGRACATRVPGHEVSGVIDELGSENVHVTLIAMEIAIPSSPGPTPAPIYESLIP